MKSVLIGVQIALSIALSLAILVQSKGVGLSETFGGGEGNVYTTKRGAEKFLFVATIVLSILLVANTMALAVLN